MSRGLTVQNVSWKNRSTTFWVIQLGKVEIWIKPGTISVQKSNLSVIGCDLLLPAEPTSDVSGAISQLVTLPWAYHQAPCWDHFCFWCTVYAVEVRRRCAHKATVYFYVDDGQLYVKVRKKSKQIRVVHGSIFITHDPTQPTDIQIQPNPTHCQVNLWTHDPTQPIPNRTPYIEQQLDCHKKISLCTSCYRQ